MLNHQRSTLKHKCWRPRGGALRSLDFSLRKPVSIDMNLARHESEVVLVADTSDSDITKRNVDTESSLESSEARNKVVSCYSRHPAIIGTPGLSREAWKIRHDDLSP